MGEARAQVQRGAGRVKAESSSYRQARLVRLSYIQGCSSHRRSAGIRQLKIEKGISKHDRQCGMPASAGLLPSAAWPTTSTHGALRCWTRCERRIRHKQPAAGTPHTAAVMPSGTPGGQSLCALSAHPQLGGPLGFAACWRLPVAEPVLPNCGPSLNGAAGDREEGSAVMLSGVGARRSPHRRRGLDSYAPPPDRPLPCSPLLLRRC